MTWICKTCGASSKGHSLDGPMMHTLMNPDHEVVPDIETRKAWNGLLVDTVDENPA